MNKIKNIIGLILLCAGVAFSQTASLTIASLKAQVGDTVNVPINAENLSNVGAISLTISYNATILQYVGVQNGAVSFTNNATNGNVLLAWFDATSKSPLNISSGKLVDLRFKVLSSSQATLNFISNQSSISDESGNTVSSNLTNGAVNNVTGASLSLPSLKGNVGDTVVVPINAGNLSNVGAISLKLSYNASILSFVGTDNGAVTLTDNSTNGVISLGWFDNTAKAPLNLSSGKLVDLKFVVNSTTTDYLNFLVSQCEVSDETGNNITVLYTNGTVNAITTSSTSLMIEKVIAAPGKEVSVPVKVYGFNNVGAISLKINYNNAVLTFDSLSNAPKGVSFTSNASGGVISIGWFDATAKSPVTLDSSVIFDLNFTYTGGQSDLTFNVGQCDISDNSGASIQGVNYDNGGVVAATGTSPTFHINSVLAKSNSTVSIPLIGRDLHHIGAISLQINYDSKVLSFEGISNPVNGIDITSYASEGVISLSWYQTSTNAINVDSATIADLNFNFIGGSSNLSFINNKSEIADSVGNIIQTAVYLDGSIMANSKPYFIKSLSGVKTIIAGDTLSFTYTAADSNAGQILTFLLVKNPGHASINSSTGLFTFIAPKDTLQGGSYVIGVTDGIDTISSEAFNIRIVTGLEVLPGSNTPTAYNLSQNYPNPFNPSTQINFDLPKESHVVLKIYNALGQEVTTLVNRNMPTGSYKYQFNADNLPSGIYIYRLQAGSFNSVRKMVLLK